MAGKEAKDQKEGCCQARSVLWYLVFIGFAVNYMLRLNMNIIIVSMVKNKPIKNNETLTSECIKEINFTIVQYLNNSSTTPSVFVNLNSSHAVEETTKVPIYKRSDISPTYDWDEKQQNFILGSFFWLHWVTQLPGGLLANKYGTKIVFGLSNFLAVLGSYAIPYAAECGMTYIIILRVLQGFCAGFAWPSMHTMVARWVPPNERSKFVTAYLGSSVGVAVTYPMCGYIIDKFGWEYAYHACGVIGTLWFCGWCFLVFDSPEQHPRISKKEKLHILESLGETIAKESRAPVPWAKILTSVPFLMNVLAQWGGVWGLFTLMNYAPTYFKVVHGWNIRATGILSGLPHIVRVLTAFVCSICGDYFLRNKILSRSVVRKIATGICTLGQGICMLLLSYSGCNYSSAIIFLTLAIGMNGAVSTGPLPSFVDLSPNYASVLLGLTNTLVAVIGFIIPIIVGYLTFQNQTVVQWQKVFWIATGMLLISGVMYSIFSISEVQDWNDPVEAKRKLHEKELMLVNSKKEVTGEKQAEIVNEKTSILYSDKENNTNNTAK